MGVLPKCPKYRKLVIGLPISSCMCKATAEVKDLPEFADTDESQNGLLRSWASAPLTIVFVYQVTRFSHYGNSSY